MATALSAHVIPEDGDAFDAPVANLTPSSLFLLTEAPLAFKQALTLKLGEISLHGEIAFTCVEPPGVVVVFRPTADALDALEDFMESLPALVGGTSGTSLEEFRAMSDAEIDALPEGDPEGPTNTEGEPVDVEEEGEDRAQEAAAEVREAFQRSKFPPNLATERVGSDQLLAAKSAALARRPGDRDPTVIPTSLDLDTFDGIDDATESGLSSEESDAQTPEVAPPADVEFDEKTVVPRTEDSTDETAEVSET